MHLCYMLCLSFENTMKPIKINIHEVFFKALRLLFPRHQQSVQIIFKRKTYLVNINNKPFHSFICYGQIHLTVLNYIYRYQCLLIECYTDDIYVFLNVILFYSYQGN